MQNIPENALEKKKNENVQASRNFKVSEFACKCGCGFNRPHYVIIDMIQHARDIFRRPIVINSACRCQDHNKKVNGSPDSAHLKGKALDIKTHNSFYRYYLVVALMIAGFKRIGISRSYIHADIDNTKPHPCIFLCRKNDKRNGK